MPTQADVLSIMTAAHETRRMAYYTQGGGLEYALAVLKDSTDTRAPAAHYAVQAAKDVLYLEHCRATKAEDDAVRALLRAEAARDESGATDAE
jgi:hypothetical protein